MSIHSIHRSTGNMFTLFASLFPILFLLLGWFSFSEAFIVPTRIKDGTPSALLMGLRGKRIKQEKRKAREEPTPPRIETPYGQVRLSLPPKSCEKCNGRGLVRCNVCEGRGVIRATGTRKTNRVQASKATGTRWTSVETRMGHRQYRVIEVKGSKKKDNLELRMGNVCGDPVDFWIPVEELMNKMIWRMGWTTLEEILLAEGGPLLDVRLCHLCKGEKIRQCSHCSGEGMIPSYEPLHE